jgi:hypothetical protein
MKHTTINIYANGYNFKIAKLKGIIKLKSELTRT